MLIPLGPTMTFAALVQTVLSLLPAPAPAPGAPDRPGAPTPPAAAGLSEHPVFGPPLTGRLRVLDPFRPPADDWMAGHRGVDLAAAAGDRVLASGEGLVLWAGQLAGRGVVSVLHGDGRRTTYEPLAPSVEPGDLVDRGDPLGRIAPGVSHCGAVPACLHWGLLRGDTYLDPLSLIAPFGRPRLLPLGQNPP